MKNIKIIVVGKVKEEYFRNIINEYIKDINRYVSVELIEVSDESIPKNPSQIVVDGIKEKEGDKILSHIQNIDYVIPLCIEGKLTDNSILKEKINSAIRDIQGSVCFIIGGSLGLSDRVIKRGNYRLSFSKMTFPHQLMRVMLLEEIARAVAP
ncbi:MAG: 23S rRNA (pseudouridine(1915)-N(3))-methyltransferase RlmH [Lachnospiraceae bacterium]|nr:23S rRNA (pseudouridine(1915)-N(3))-methyltransferase RlmH [Lachnospiraceae bacterium]